MLSSGARRLAESKAVVKTLTDVETLGGTTVINSDKTGTLTMNAMTATTLFTDGQWFKIEGPGYRKEGRIRSAAGAPVPDFHRLALGCCLCTDATVSDEGIVVGDPTEAAFVVLAAKVGVDAEETRERYLVAPRFPLTRRTSSWPPCTTARTGWSAASSSNHTSCASRVHRTSSSNDAAVRCGTASRCPSTKSATR